MTREEKIAELKRHREEVKNDFGWNTSLLESLDMALLALSTEGEYIKKEDLFNKTIKRNSIWNGTTNAEGKGLEEIVNDLPTYSFPDSAEIKGEWKMPIQDDGMSDPIYYQVRCSRCGFDIDPQTWYEELHQFNADNFCPNCGADMRGEADGK